MSSKGAECPYKRLADSLRDKKGVQWASAKLEAVDGDGDYVEYFRGKDFARYFRAAPEKMNDLVQPVRIGRGVEDQIRDLMHFFVNKGLVLKAERKYKRPKPGKPRLVKFPRTIETCRDQSWDEQVFYAWRYERPTSIWYYVGTAAIPILVILACLFPLAPWWMRMAFIYALMGLLSVLLGLIAIRYVLFCLVWTVLGHSFWLFPNMMSDEVGVFDAFRPLISYSLPDKKKPSLWKQRMVTGALAGLVFYALYAHSPNVDHMKDEAKRAHDQFMDYMDLHSTGKAFLEGSSTGAAEPLYQQASAQRGGIGYDPTGGKARASQKMREQFEAEQRERLLKEEEERLEREFEARNGTEANATEAGAEAGEAGGAGEKAAEEAERLQDEL